MSYDEWERGTLVLPAAGLVQVKTAVREHCRKFHTDVRAEVGDLHAQVGRGTRSASVYRAQLSEAQQAAVTRSSDYADTVRSAALAALDRVVMRAEGRLGGGAPSAVRAPTVDDQTWEAPPVDNRCTMFGVHRQRGGVLAGIFFDARTVSWDVWESNHTVESSRDAPLGRVFFAALSTVRWTSGTGGIITGNAEANRGSDDADAGATSITAAFGPLGEVLLGDARRAAHIAGASSR